MAEKKKSRIVRFFRFVFVDNILQLFFAVLFGGLLWTIMIALGMNSNAVIPLDGDFFKALLDNLIASFTGLENIIINSIDLFLFIALIFAIFAFLHRYHASLLLRVIIPITLLAVVCTSKVLALPVMGEVLSNGILILCIGILVMFPQELRRGMWKMASPSEAESFNTQYDCTEEELHQSVTDIVRAVLNMSKDNEGALIVIATQTIPEHIIESGTKMDAVLSQYLIECLFNKKANLHDGAMFIRGNRIISAGCFLPLTQSQNLSKELGTRHRAAMGVTEQYPVLAIIVSEESGIISICKHGQLERYYDGEMLADAIQQEFGLKAVTKTKKGRKLF